MACFYFVNITDKEFKMKQHGMFNPKLMFYLLKCTFLVYMDIDFILKKKNHFKGEVFINCHNRFNIKSRPMICEKNFLHAHC